MDEKVAVTAGPDPDVIAARVALGARLVGWRAHWRRVMAHCDQVEQPAVALALGQMGATREMSAELMGCSVQRVDQLRRQGRDLLDQMVPMPDWYDPAAYVVAIPDGYDPLQQVRPEP